MSIAKIEKKKNSYITHAGCNKRSITIKNVKNNNIRISSLLVTTLTLSWLLHSILSFSFFSFPSFLSVISSTYETKSKRISDSAACHGKIEIM